MSSLQTITPVRLRRRTAPLETAHAQAMAATLGMHSRLPSPPDDDHDVSSDDTITDGATRNWLNGNGNAKSYGELDSGIPNAHHSPMPSISSRLSSTPATRASSNQYSSEASTRQRLRQASPSTLSSSSSSDDDETHVMNDTAHSIASSNSWADLPLLITFIPPIIALFTGGDYLRDVLLTCLLVWYLYQLIKVPWDIYLASLPPPHAHTASDGRSSSRRRHAHTQLRTTRLLALLLSALTPFFGASLLRFGCSYLYAEPLSWFSTSLFVLAAGIRPWRHLTHLLLTRTDALHLAAHRPSHLRPAFLAKIAAPHNEKRERETARIEALEAELVHLREELAALAARTKGMSKALKGLENNTATRSDMIEGRVEVLERHGNGQMQQGGVWGGMNMIGSGISGVVRSVLCAAFPFMARPAASQPARSSGVGRGGKKAKRLRGVVNNLPPVFEADESVAQVSRGERKEDLGVYASSSSNGGVSAVVDMVTWPFRAMRAILATMVKGVVG